MPKVLVVEDEDLLRLEMVKKLNEAGFEALAARTGYAAMQIAREQAPVAIALDYHLPDMDAQQVIREMKQTDLAVCVVVTSAHLTPKLTADLMQQGVFNCVEKPLDFDYLIGELLRGIGRGWTINLVDHALQHIARLEERLVAVEGLNTALQTRNDELDKELQRVGARVERLEPLAQWRAWLFRMLYALACYAGASFAVGQGWVPENLFVPTFFGMFSVLLFPGQLRDAATRALAGLGNGKGGRP